MFFKREKLRKLSFSDRLSNLSEFGFQVQNQGGKAKVTRDGFGAILAEAGDQIDMPEVGLVVGNEIGELVHGGYQMFFRTSSGITKPALANQLKGLHAFQEDLREGCGLTSLYNQSLGSTCTGHMYDRVEERDRGGRAKAWQKS